MKKIIVCLLSAIIVMGLLYKMKTTSPEETDLNGIKTTSLEEADLNGMETTSLEEANPNGMKTTSLEETDLNGMETTNLEESDLISKIYQVDGTVSTIIVEEIDASIVVQSIETDTISIECVELPEDALYDFSVSDNVLIIKKRKTISEAIDKNIITREYFLTITIPQKEYDNISIVNTLFGSVVLEKVDARTISVNTLFGSVVLEKVDARTISIDVMNGDIIPNRTTSNDFSGKVINGTISFDHSNSVTYRCQVTNGSIKGTIAGNKEDYTITATAINGKNKLNNQIIDNSCYLMEFDVINGGISVQFTD